MLRLASGSLATAKADAVARLGTTLAADAEVLLDLLGARFRISR